MNNCKSKILKISFILIILLAIMYIIFPHSVSAIDFNTATYEPDSMDQVSNAGKLQEIGNTIIGAIRTIGSIISVVVLIILGIKYMIGSAEERAEYKKTMLPYLIGAVLVFGITNLLVIIADLSKNLL